MTTRLYGGVKGYWRRRRYERLGGGESGQNGRRRWFWRIRLTSKLKLKLKRKLKLRYSPKKLLTGIRDCYVNLMMRMASSPMLAGGGFGEGVVKFGTRPAKEYDDKLIVEIYKTLAMRQAQLVPIDGSEIADRR
ncbi:hypothetical protein SSX86_026937 [Deinandra increscens subsp. villosa]|uniref:Uncharacterized protein n=1 Tax=Deinandra increscens subsp. villosa TaxID=3103831 RepID=A0AAP0CKS6_9ASTR